MSTMIARYGRKPSKIKTWKQFAHKVRSKGCNLLKRIDEFPDSVLVAGCQRSGTTMLARLITQNEAMVNYYLCPDDELAAKTMRPRATFNTAIESFIKV